MALDYKRYELLKNDDGTLRQMPFVEIPTTPTDKYVEWKNGDSRMDRLSQKYYDSPFYDFLIMYANPQHISEFDIDDGVIIRIPFPLKNALTTYETRIKNR